MSKNRTQILHQSVVTNSNRARIKIIDIIVQNLKTMSLFVLCIVISIGWLTSEPLVTAKDLESTKIEAKRLPGNCRNLLANDPDCQRCCYRDGSVLEPGREYYTGRDPRIARCLCVVPFQAPHLALIYEVKKRETTEEKKSCDELMYETGKCRQCCFRRWRVRYRAAKTGKCKCARLGSVSGGKPFLRMDFVETVANIFGDNHDPINWKFLDEVFQNGPDTWTTNGTSDWTTIKTQSNSSNFMWITNSSNTCIPLFSLSSR